MLHDTACVDDQAYASSSSPSFSSFLANHLLLAHLVRLLLDLVSRAFSLATAFFLVGVFLTLSFFVVLGTEGLASEAAAAAALVEVPRGRLYFFLRAL